MKLVRGFMACVLALLIPISVHAAEDLKENVVSKNKVWSVKFNDKVDISTVKGNVYVKDSKGNKIVLDVYIREDGKSITVTPPNGEYIQDETYVLYVDKSIKSISGKFLKQSSELKFMVKEDAGEIDKKVKEAEVNIAVYNYDNTVLRTGKGYVIDSKVITNYSVISQGTKAEIILGNGKRINIKSVINYNKDENIAVMSLEEGGAPTLNSSVYVVVEKVGESLTGKLTYDVITKRLIKVYDYSLIEVKQKEISEPSLRFCEKGIKEYFSKVNGLEGVYVDAVYIEKNPNNKNMLNVYLIMESKNMEELLGHILSNSITKDNVEQWLHSINGYMANNFIGYTIETKLNGEIKDRNIVDEINSICKNSFDYNELTKIYTLKSAIVTNYEANGKGYYAWHQALR